MTEGRSIGAGGRPCKRDVELLGADANLFFNVRNLLDQDPPYVWSSNIQQVNQVNNTKYDILGRHYRVGDRFKYQADLNWLKAGAASPKGEAALRF